MENGAQPAAGRHWLADAPPNIRDTVVQKIMKICPQGNNLHDLVSQLEERVFSNSHNLQDYLRAISMKMTSIQQKRSQSAMRDASDNQQQVHADAGHPVQPLNTVLANSSTPAMALAASTLPLSGRPHQVQNLHVQVNQAQTSFETPVAPVVQLDPRYPTGVTQVQTQCLARNNFTQQPQPQLTRMNQQQDLRHSHQTHGGQRSNVATIQTGYHEGQNNMKQFGDPQVQKNDQQDAVEVDWREEMFQKITPLKDAHLSELMEFERVLRTRVPQSKPDEQLKSLPKEEADEYRKVVDILARIRCVLRFLQFEKSSIPELAKDQFDKCQTAIYRLLQFYRKGKARPARTNAGFQSQNCHELPRVVNITGVTDNSQQKHEEQPSAAEALPQTLQHVPAEIPLAQQQIHSDHLAGEAANGGVHRVAEPPVAINLTPVTGDTAPFVSGTYYQQMQQEHLTDEAIFPLTQNVHPAGTSPAQLQQTHSAHEAEDDSVKPDAASDVGVNLKRDFGHTTPGTADGSSCKRRKMNDGFLRDEIRAACSMLVETDISISEDDTGGADGTVINLSYNAVSLSPALRAVIDASAISLKLLVPADYPESSPEVIHHGGELKSGIPGVVDMAFRRSLVLLPEPRSIEAMARAWDSITRTAVVKFANRLGGGTFSSRYPWVSCNTV